MSKFAEHLSQELIFKLYDATKVGDMNFILHHEKIGIFPATIKRLNAVKMMELASSYNQCEVLQFLMESEFFFDLVFGGDSYWYKEKEDLIRMACEHGHLQIVDYLLVESPLAKRRYYDYYINEGKGLKSAIQEGQLNVVTYLLDKFSTNENLIESVINGELVDHAISYGKKDIVEYLLTSPDMKKFEMNLSEYDIFKSIIHIEHDKDKVEMLKFFIFDLNIEKTPDIDELLDFFTTPEAEKMFLTRELKENLETTVSSKKKIKI